MTFAMKVRTFIEEIIFGILDIFFLDLGNNYEDFESALKDIMDAYCIALIRHHRHHRQWFTCFEYYWPVLAILSQIYALFGVFFLIGVMWCTEMNKYEVCMDVLKY